jgi:hypothetical protein
MLDLELGYVMFCDTWFDTLLAHCAIDSVILKPVKSLSSVTGPFGEALGMDG